MNIKSDNNKDIGLNYMNVTGIGINVDLRFTMYNNISLIKNNIYIDLNNILFKDIYVNKQYNKTLSIKNINQLPVKIRWDKFNNENIYSVVKKLIITPKEAVLEPEGISNFNITYINNEIGYEN